MIIKLRLLLCLLFFVITSANAQYTSIPDTDFEAMLGLEGYDDIAGDGQVPTASIETVSTLFLDYPDYTIRDLTGIEDFTALQQLYASGNAITVADFSNNKNLTVLYMEDSPLETLTITSNSELTAIALDGPVLNTIDFSGNKKLKTIEIIDGTLTSLNLNANEALESFTLDRVSISTIDFGANTNLKTLKIRNGTLTSLNLSNNTNIQIIEVNDNNLSHVNLRNGENAKINSFIALSNPNLTCIQVDNVAYAQTNFTRVGSQATFTDVSCIDYTSIPDTDFEAMLGLEGYDDNSKDGQVPTALIETVGTLVLNYPDYTIQDLTGIEDFTALQQLYASGNAITVADFSNNKNLTALYMEGNPLATLTITSNSELIEISLDDAVLNTIDFSGNKKLKTIEIVDATFTSLDLSANEALESFSLDRVNINTIDFSSNTNLKTLKINNGTLTSLDLSNNTNIQAIQVVNNNLSSLNLRNGENTKINSFVALTNPNLTCIQVSDVDHFRTNFSNRINSQAFFSETDCSSYVAVTDANFEAALEALGYDDISNDGQVPVWLINEVTTLNIENKGIADLTGIEGFTALVNLNCIRNTIKELDMKGNPSLEVLNCSRNFIDSLNVQTNLELKELICERNGNLKHVIVSNNQKLERLDLERTGISSINVANNAMLKNLDIRFNNPVQSLDISGNPNLETLLCNGTNIPSLDASGHEKLKVIHTQDNNNLRSINLANTEKLEQLLASKTKLSSIDVSDCVALKSINLSNTQITEIDLSSNGFLETVDFSNNSNLTRLNIQNGNNRAITSFSATNTPNLTCITVDDVAYSTATWTNVDVGAPFNTFCDYTVIPDANFEAALSAYDDIPNDGQVPRPAISVITNLDVSNQGISDLTGIEDFTSLEALNIRENTISSLDVSNNTELTLISAQDNVLNAIDVTDLIKLVSLGLARNQLTSINVSSNSALQEIYLASNLLTSLDLSKNPNLEIIGVNSNNLTSLNIKNGNNDKITTLSVTGGNTNLSCILVDDITYAQTNFTLIDVQTLFTDTDCSQIYTAIPDPVFEAALSQYDNIPNDGQVPTSNIASVTSVNVRDAGISNLTGIEAFVALEELDFIDNDVSSVNLTNAPNLRVLRLRNNSVSSIDLSKNTNLVHLLLENNGVEDLDLSDNLALEELYLAGNELTSVDLRNHTALRILGLDTNKLEFLNVKNGNNANMTIFSINNNPDLYCIAVDDVTYAQDNFTNVDDQVIFSDVTCIDYTLIPDANFEIILGLEGFDDFPGDGRVPTASIENVQFLVLEYAAYPITDLTGIEDFTKLKDIYADNQSIQAANLSNNLNLRDIYFEDNPITSITLPETSTLIGVSVEGTLLEGIDISKNPGLRSLSADNSKIKTLDCSQNGNLQDLYLNNAELTSLNLQNGNNAQINTQNFDIRNNPNLTCVQVDDIAYSTTYWTNVDATTSFTNTEYCRYTQIPDANFEAALENLGYDDISGDRQVPTTLIEVVTYLELGSQGISDLTGIEDFVALIDFRAENNGLTNLDFRNNPLLEELYLRNNPIATLDITNNTFLKSLLINTGTLNSIDISNNSNLGFFQIENTDIESVNLSNSPNLQVVYLANNNLSSLNIKNGFNNNIQQSFFVTTGNPNLTCISVDDLTYANTYWTNIDVQTSFTGSYCRYTQIPDASFEARLENLGYDDISGDGQVPTALIETVTSLELHASSITDLTGIGDFAALTSLDLSYSDNALTTLDVSNNTNLVTLIADTSNFDTLNLGTNTKYETIIINANKLTEFQFSNLSNLKTLNLGGNPITDLDLSTYTALETFNARFCNLSNLNIKNGNNRAIVDFQVTNNASLTCITVDDVAYSTENWTIIDPQTSFSTNCESCAMNVSAYLEGPYNATDAKMNDALRSNSILPLVSPHQDSATSTLTAFEYETENEVVDWVELQLRSVDNIDTILAQQSFLIKRNGEVVDIDGFSTPTINFSQGDYYVALAHRNHLTVVSNTPITFDGSIPTIDFTTTANVLNGTNALIEVSSSVFALPAGNVENSGQIQNSGINNTILRLGVAGYSVFDVDMNGQVQNTDINLIQKNLGKGEQIQIRN